MSIRVHIHKYVYTYINTRVCKSSCAARECAFFLLLRLEQTFDPGARENRVGYIFFFFLSAPRALLWPVYVPLQRFGDSVTPGRTSKRLRERERAQSFLDAGNCSRNGGCVLSARRMCHQCIYRYVAEGEGCNSI